jgi:hypothetical protein
MLSIEFLLFLECADPSALSHSLTNSKPAESVGIIREKSREGRASQQSSRNQKSVFEFREMTYGDE